MINKEYMYDYFFQFNPYTQVWTAMHRDDKENYFNGTPLRHMHRSGASLDKLLVELMKRFEMA